MGRDGRPGPQISFAYPQTREFVLDLLRDVTRYPVDGICMLYNRRAGLLEYEPPIVEGFKAAFDKDPRDLANDNPEWLKFRAGFPTGFMRDLRQEMDLEISALVMSSL